MVQAAHPKNQDTHQVLEIPTLLSAEVVVLKVRLVAESMEEAVVDQTVAPLVCRCCLHKETLAGRG